MTGVRTVNDRYGTVYDQYKERDVNGKNRSYTVQMKRDMNGQRLASKKTVRSKTVPFRSVPVRSVRSDR